MSVYPNLWLQNTIQTIENAGSFSAMALLVFDGENYQAWAVKMQAYLKACDLWQAVEKDYEVLSLTENPTIQIKAQKESRNNKVQS